MKRAEYNQLSRPLHIELIKMQRWVRETGQRVLVIFEGRDAAGKGGAIKHLIKHLHPRHYWVVALDQPTDHERSQWYFQRYFTHLPAAGELVLFDRSWYNRAGLERVYGFCTPAEAEEFLTSIPALESMLVRSGIQLIKLYFTITRETQARRLEARRTNPLKRWKLTELDLAALDHWDDFTRVEEEMFQRTSTDLAPWVCVDANDKRGSRIEVTRFLLGQLDYPDKNAELLNTDPTLVRPVSAGGKHDGSNSP